MQEIRNNCFGWKNVARPFVRRKQLSTSAEYVAVTFRHSCLTFFPWRRVVLCFFDLKQLLRVSCILWFYYPKCYSIINSFGPEYIKIYTDESRDIDGNSGSNPVIELNNWTSSLSHMSLRGCSVISMQNLKLLKRL